MKAIIGETMAVNKTQPNISESNVALSYQADNIALNPQLALRPYQSESLSQIEKAYKRGNNRLLVSLPTGTGKTVVFAHLVARSQGRSLIIAHREELLEQAADKVRMVIPTADVGIVKAHRNETSSKIVVASVQTLARGSRLEQLGKDFSTIIIDEAHHAAADSYIKVLTSLGCFDKKNAPLTLGVTATPERGDKVGLDNVFQEIVYHRNLLDMISEQYLSDLTWQSVDLDVNLDNIGTRAGDFIESDLIKALTNSDTPKQILLAFQEYAPSRKTIIFVPGVELARQTAKLFQQHKISCESIDGKLSYLERKSILSRLKTGQTQVVINCLILTEGFDESSIECIIFARPTKSKGFYLQMLGRGTRLHPGKSECLIIDLVGVSKKHKLITLPNLFGLSPDKLKQKSVLTAHNEEIAHQAKLKALAQEESELQDKADEALDTTTPQAPSLEATEAQEDQRVEPRVINFNWLKLSETRYALSIGKGILFLVKQPNTQDMWASVCNKMDKTNLLIAKDLPLDYAQGVAEDYVRGLGTLALIDSNASWRNHPITDKQMALLDKLHIDYSSDINKGQASDLITIYIASQYVDVDKLLFELTQAQETEAIDTEPCVEQHSSQFSSFNINFNASNITEINNINHIPKEPTEVEAKKTSNHLPIFANYCFAKSTEQLKLYDSYTLNNYADKGQIGQQPNRSQIEAFLSITNYIEDFLNQEIGLIIAGKAAVGKTHLAVGMLKKLKLNYGLSTFFCDCEAAIKRANKKGYNQVLSEILHMAQKSNVILLDNLTLRSIDFNQISVFSEIIDYCSKDERKLIITTKHLSYSSSSSYDEDPASQLSLGDVFGIGYCSKLYEKSVYLEIVTNRPKKPIPNSNSEDFSSISSVLSSITGCAGQRHRMH